MSNYLDHTTAFEDRELESVFEALSEGFGDRIKAVLNNLCERFEDQITELQNERDNLQTKLDSKE